MRITIVAPYSELKTIELRLARIEATAMPGGYTRIIALSPDPHFPRSLGTWFHVPTGGRLEIEAL